MPQGSSSGQTTLEFLLSAGTLVLALTAAGWLLRMEWIRGQCAHLLFEGTRARLSGVELQIRLPKGFRLAIHEGSWSVEGEIFCEGIHQTLSLPKLEAAQW